MAEENRCIRCGKPCAPNETMCEECKAWFQSQTQADPGKARLKTAEPKKQENQETQKTQKTQKQTSVPPAQPSPGQPETEPKKGKKGVLIAVIAVVVVCLIMAAVIFFMKKKGTEEQQTTDVVQDTQTDIAEQEPEEQPWDTADIASINGEICTLYGTVEGSELKLDSVMSFYILSDSGQKYFFREVEYVALNAIEENIRLSRYSGRPVEVTGYPFCADNVVYIQVETLETTDGSTAAELEEGIHSYQYVVKDCTWNEAFSASIADGGYLVHFNSMEEYDYVMNEINSRGLDGIHFYLGARRDSGGGDYFWVDENNTLYGEPINSSSAWCSGEWLSGEPSYSDPDLGIDEAYLNMFYMRSQGRFVWADGPDNIPSAVPVFSGKVGYIIEYEEW